MRYRSSRVFSLGGWTPHLLTGLACPVILLAAYSLVAYGAFTLFGPPFQAVRLELIQLKAPTTPGRIPVWAMSAFARRYLRNPCLSLFLWVLRCFSSLGLPLHTMNSCADDGRSFRRVSTFRNLRINARLPASPSVSSAITSFIASRCQGIHHVPLVT